jgi:heptosyltransferase II
MPKHLIVKVNSIGDVIMAIPGVRQFKDSAGGEVHWLVGRSSSSIVGLYPWVDEIIEVADHDLFGPSKAQAVREILRVWGILAGRRYDTISVLHADWRYGILAWPVRAQRRLSLSNRDRSRMLLKGRSRIDEYARVLLRQDGFAPLRLPPIPAPDLSTGSVPDSGRPRVILVPGGARNLLRDDPQRRWPLDYYVALAGILLKNDIDVILIGGPDERELAAAFPVSPRIVNLIGKIPLKEVLAVMRDSDLIVTQDTGPLHMAGLTDIPVIALFGPTDPAEFAPHRDGIYVFRGGASFACRPCYDGRSYPHCPSPGCMKELTPDMVSERALQILSERGRRAEHSETGELWR